jgi:hypothetical protein
MACLSIISQWLTLVYHEQINSKNYQQVVYGYSSGRICRGSWGGSDHCAWPEVPWPEATSVTWPEVTPFTCPVRKYVLRLRNRKLRNIRPSWAFLIGSDKVTWPEEALSGSDPTGSMFSAFPLFTPCVFFLSSSNMATGCDLRSLDSFGVPLGVRIRNRKLRNTRSDRRSRDPFGSVLGCSLRRPRLITIGNPASYI